MKNRNIFTSERFILSIIIINSIVIFLQESGVSSPVLNVLDALCTVIFIIEMVSKNFILGIKGYWKSGWNCMDGILVILSIPSLVSYFVSAHLLDLSIVLILRILRVFRFFRLVHIFPNFGFILKNLWKALRDSLPIFIGFFILIVVASLFSCALFRDVLPQYFATPFDSLYTTFRLCTVEGWYEIPDALSKVLEPGQVVLVRIYFITIIVFGGIIGLSLVNSIFVDAMVSDNNAGLEKEIRELNNKVDELVEQLKQSSKNNLHHL